MTDLIERLYPLPDYRRTPLSLLRWWESRRLFYNRVVGSTGLVTVAGTSLIWMLPPHALPIPLLPILAMSAVYGLLANVCYSSGWLLELLAVRVWGREAPDVGPMLFRQGLIFSVGLTLMPLLISMMMWVLRVVVSVAG